MWTYTADNTFLERLAHGDDLLVAIKRVFVESGFRMGVLMAIGATKRASIAVYDQQKKTFNNLSIEEPTEILSCVGNVSTVEGDISVHAHITLGFDDGTVRGGHLLEGTVIFACELFGMALEGQQLERVFDDVTGLKLWGFSGNQSGERP